MAVVRATTLHSGYAVYRPVWGAQITVPVMGNAAQRQKLEKSDDVITFPASPKAAEQDRRRRAREARTAGRRRRESSVR